MTQAIQTTTRALNKLAEIRGKPFANARVTGADPVVPSRFKVGESIASVLAASGAIVADMAAAQGKPAQMATCDAALATATLAIGRYTGIDDGAGNFVLVEPDPVGIAARAITRPWPTRDGRYFLPHLSLPHLRDRVLGVLKCEATPDAISAAVAKRDSDELENAIAAARGCGGKTRTQTEWRAHPHGQILATRPVISIERIGDAPAEPVKGGEQPLSGLRVLDLTRILAGPIAARTLGENGADVLMVAAEHLPQSPDFVRDTSHGKRSCFLDLNQPNEAEKLRELIAGADVFSQGYRPGVLEARGLGPAELARIRPGIVALSISCYGHGGPLSDRAGWEQVAQSVTGICHEQGQPDAPTLLPLPVCDYLTGYLGALGALMALERRATEGGSWHVQVSLCRTAMFLQDQGRVDGDANWPGEAETEPFMVQSNGPRGRMRMLGPVTQLPLTPAKWRRQSPILGQDRAEWL